MADSAVPALQDQQTTALTETSSKPDKNAIDTFMQSHTVQHFGRLIGLAVAVAIGVVVALWTTEPNFSPLYQNVSGKDASEIAQVLQQNDIQYRIDPVSGTVMVEQSKSAEARMKLAAQGLPQSTSVGLEMLEKDQGLGTSQFIETARYNHALEQELAQSIESLRSVESARVHLAMPKQSIFIRNRTEPSASVVTKLYGGRSLNKGQVDAIVNMVASSIPRLDPKMVTVVDQFGHLLSEDDDTGLALTTKQFDYTKKIENSYADRIISLLEPIVGEGKVNTEVSAQLDFSAVESTREAYDPERSVIRSEQISEEEIRNFAQAGGIPGALSNQPPGTGTTNANATQNTDGSIPANQNRTATRNFEVDRVISHTQHSVGSVQRLSVAVVIDNKTKVKEDGTIESIPYTDEEIARFNSLIRQTVGFNETRGDTLSVINASFVETKTELVEVPLWQQLLNTGWLIDLVKQIFGAIGLLIVYFMFGKPLLKSLNPNKVMIDEQGHRIDPETGEIVGGGATSGTPLPPGASINEEGKVVDAEGNEISEEELEKERELSLLDDPDNPANLIRRSNATYEQKIEMARNIVMDDPARVANVMKNWVGAE